jgi:hypothetical protein
MSFRLSRALSDISIAALVIGLAACSAASSDPNTFGNGSGGGGGTDNGSGGGGGDASVNPDGSGGSGGLLIDASLGDGSMNADAACAAEHAKAEQLPLDLYIMVDRSGSMDDYNSPTKWEKQSTALNAFFNDPGSAGLFIAMRFFPIGSEMNMGSDSQCTGSGYVKPLVDWGELPGLAPTLSQAISSTGPDGYFTPTQAALHGVLEGAKQRQIAEPLHIVAAVFASDGEPCCGDCPCEANSCIGQIAADYANGSPPIKTFAIAADTAAMGVLTSIAQQGGTNAPFNASGSAQQFIDALNAIRGSLLACEYKVPVPEAGTVNPQLVQVQFTPTGATDPISIPRVDGVNQCGNNPGWYYDDNNNPSKLVFCPATCSMVQNDQDGKLDILLGCSNSQT